jgi:hypothetical protein
MNAPAAPRSRIFHDRPPTRRMRTPALTNTIALPESRPRDEGLIDCLDTALTVEPTH